LVIWLGALVYEAIRSGYEYTALAGIFIVTGLVFPSAVFATCMAYLNYSVLLSFVIFFLSYSVIGIIAHFVIKKEIGYGFLEWGTYRRKFSEE
jgi:hypothetical protein